MVQIGHTTIAGVAQHGDSRGPKVRYARFVEAVGVEANRWEPERRIGQNVYGLAEIDSYVGAVLRADGEECDKAQSAQQ